MKNTVKLCLTNPVMNATVVVLEIHTATPQQTAQLRNFNHPNDRLHCTKNQFIDGYC